MKAVNLITSREFSIGELCLAAIKKIKIISIVSVCFAIALFLASNYLIEWRYEASTQIYVLSNQITKQEVTYSDLQTSSQLIKDYMILITSRPVMEQIVKDLDLDFSYSELERLIRIENPNETRIINITVDYKDPVVAKQIADGVTARSSTLITKVTGQELLGHIEEANLPVKPASPNVMRNTLLGGAIGGIICTFICLLRYILDDTIRTPEHIEEYLGVRLLATLPIEGVNKQISKRNH